jgi:hypothetical protein
MSFTRVFLTTAFVVSGLPFAGCNNDDNFGGSS